VFQDDVFLGVDVESLLDEEQVSLLETSVPVRKGHNLLYDRWMTLKILEEFSDVIFLGVDVEVLLDTAEVSSLQTSVPVRKGYNL
jgi:hypothetical protein